jgi:hypothetical protein
MSFANRDTLTVSLSICIPFISSSYLSALARNFRKMLNKSGESDHPCLIPDGKWCQFFPTKYDVGYRLVIYSL